MKLIIKEFYLGENDSKKRFVLAVPINGKDIYVQPLTCPLQFNTMEEILDEIARLDPKDELEVELTRVNRYRKFL
jgi:hypothetical protein